MEGAHVEGLFLRPHKLSARVPPQLPHHQVEGERRQLQPPPQHAPLIRPPMLCGLHTGMPCTVARLAQCTALCSCTGCTRIEVASD